MPESRKVVHMTSVHRVRDTRILNKECRTLQRSGYEVVLIAPSDAPEMLDGVRVQPVPQPKGRAERFSATIRAVLHAALREDAAVYHFHDPELMPLGLLLKRRGKKVIYDVHEDVSRQILNKTWIPSGMRRGISYGASLTEALCARELDGLMAATPPIARRFPAGKTVTVQNFPMLDELSPAVWLPHRDRPLQAVYVGHVTPLRGAHELAGAVAGLPAGLPARMVIAGPLQPEDLGQALRARGGERLELPGWQTREEIRQLLSRSRVGLVTLHPAPNYLESYPVKLFEYMAAGLPVIASDFPLWRSIVTQADCGLLVDPLDPAAIARALQWVFEHPEEAEQMGQRGRAAVLRQYNWDIEAKKLVGFYDRLFDTVSR